MLVIPIFKPLSKYAILIEWKNSIEEAILTEVLMFEKKIQTFYNNKTIETIPIYNSLTVIFEEIIDFNKTVTQLKAIQAQPSQELILKKNKWKLPVCYHPSLGIDINMLAEKKNLSVEQIIALHTTSVYTVFGIGFLPGFLYLGELTTELHTPRRKEPRLQIPKGAVGIGGKQTGVYPQQSPGGWNIIGNCPISLFNAESQPPCFINVGDSIEFYEVSKPKYEVLCIEIETGIFKLNKEDA